MSLSGNTAVATSDQKGSGNCAAAAGTKDLVYAITPSHDGTLTIGVAPEFDAVLYARVGSCSLGMQIGCADVAGDGGNENLVINAIAGTKYSVVVDGYQGASGKFVLSADLQP
jgi:hypothetical protein